MKGKQMSKIAKNIRDLRSAYGENREDLAEAIYVSQSAIGNYETDYRLPDIQKIKAISEHYGLSIDQLLEDDFSQTNFQLSTLTWEKVTQVMAVQFPILCSEKAMQNENFEKGYKRTQEIWKRIKEAQTSITNEFAYSPLEYYEAALGECAEIDEAIANILWVVFINYSLLPDEHFDKIGEAIIKDDAQNYDFVKKYVLKGNHLTSQINIDNKKGYVKDSQETIISLLKLLKRSKIYADLADYYSAMRYAICMVDNNYSDEMNKSIGIEMLNACASLGNSYALNYFETIKEL